MPRRSAYHQPGGGFVLLVLAMIVVIGTVAWGLRTPPLDHVWRLQKQLLLGDRTVLDAGERELLQETLQRYPLLAEHMVDGADVGLVSAHVGGVVDDGVAYIVQRNAHPAQLRISSLTGGPVRITARSSSQRHTATASVYEWRLPSDDPTPQLIEVRLEEGQGPMRVELRPLETAR